MKNIKSSDFALAQADHIIAQRFQREYGTETCSRYFERLDMLTTRHLPPSNAERVRRTTGKQRRRARFTLEGRNVIIGIPMKDPRSGETIWAETEFSTYLNIVELGADGAFVMVNKGKHRGAGQVRIKLPYGEASGSSHATVARLIAGARRGQQARLLDRNPLNLRRDNVALIGNPSTPEGKVGTARFNTREQVGKRASKAGRCDKEDMWWSVW